MNSHVNAIANRLSLRPPQRTSLDILARVADILSLEKGADAAQALKALQGLGAAYLHQAPSSDNKAASPAKPPTRVANPARPRDEAHGQPRLTRRGKRK